jgi:hypothetical protein
MKEKGERENRLKECWNVDTRVENKRTSEQETGERERERRRESEPLHVSCNNSKDFSLAFQVQQK